MADDGFEPKLGQVGRTRSAEGQRFFKLVIKEGARQAASKRGRGSWLTSRPVAELGRGKGSLYALLPPRPEWRRVIVKARIARHGTSDLGAARAHQHYILRDGVTRDGAPGRLYDKTHDDVDGSDFLARQQDDRYQFRLIVSPEDSARLADLKPFVRDLMQAMERDLDTQLEWVAVDHFNTGHPHTHLIIRGRDDQGQDLVMARHYISDGIRNRARDLVTLELGPETELEHMLKMRNDIVAERFTPLDRGILSVATDGVLVQSAASADDGVRQAFRTGRLRTLAKMGLAEEKQTGVWAIDPDLEPKLRRMGERGDQMKTMFRVMREAGLDRPAGDFAIFDGATKKAPVIGKVVSMGLADEINDRHYLVIDGVDGRVHYAETSRLAPAEMPARGMIVALSGSSGKGKVRDARIEVLSYWELDRLPSAHALTWLDRVIADSKEVAIREQGFGQEIGAALKARQQWLVAQGLATRSETGALVPKKDLLPDLHQRGLTRLAQEISTELRMPHLPPFDGLHISGTHAHTVALPTMRIAVIKGRDEFTIVPWRPQLDQLRGQTIEALVRDRSIELTIGRGRGLGRGI